MGLATKQNLNPSWLYKTCSNQQLQHIFKFRISSTLSTIFFWLLQIQSSSQTTRYSLNPHLPQSTHWINSYTLSFFTYLLKILSFSILSWCPNHRRTLSSILSSTHFFTLHNRMTVHSILYMFSLYPKTPSYTSIHF